ncbi:DNA-binding MarR family transcriptional regulator [Actinomycetospora succinea]|uniref:DNA-binding MarR family transcriptional regulator n=2 Tax=Actinomycetospora succinea TaxID=663603 RepID=A0A4R6UJE1_9PSEU|nr:DNA-binding MarR family transcriptional regulator [Actinomycetospora succinea]
MTDVMPERGRPHAQASMVELREAPGHLVRRAQQRHTLLWSREFGGDLTGPQYAVICAIGADSTLDQRAVGERASLDKSSTADVVARLEGQGWLRFRKDPADARRKTLSLTALARTAIPDVTRRVAAVQASVLAPLPAGTREAFVDALRLVAYAGEPPVPGHVDDSILVLANSPGHLIRRAQQVHTVAWNEEVGRVMTAPQYAVLSALWSHAEGVDQGTGAELASVDRSSMADIVARLARRGWVARTRDVADARRRLLTLTDDARGEVAQITAAVERVQVRMLAPLPDERDRGLFLDRLRLLAYAEDVDGPDPAGP